MDVEAPYPSDVSDRDSWEKHKHDLDIEEPLTEQHLPDRYLHSWRLAIVILSLCLGTFLVALDVNIVGVAVPKITSEFNSLDDFAWYGSAYLLTVTALQPAFGTTYKYFNVKATYLVSVALFEVGSILCAAAPDSPSFIIGRAIAGLGAAGLFQGALGIIGYTVVLEKRPLYMGIVVSVFGISVCIGPVLGGVLTDRASWRWCFWINVPIGVIAFILIFFILKLKHSNERNRLLPLKERLRRLDGLGVIFFIGAICCLFLALQWGGQTVPWNSSKIIGLFIGFVVLVGLFGYIQWKRGEYATIPGRILRQRSILSGGCFLFCLGMSSFVYNFYIPLFFQSVQGVSATASGVRFIALIVPQIMFLIMAGAVVTKWGNYVLYMVVGTIVACLGSGFVTTFNVSTPPVKWAAWLVVNGIGMGTSMQLPYTAVQLVLREDDVPTGNGLFVFTWQLGGALGLSICQTILINNLKRILPKRIPSISPEAVIQAGAANLSKLTTDPQILHELRETYSSAINGTFILALTTVCLAVVFALCMERLNVKDVVREKETDKQ